MQNDLISIEPQVIQFNRENSQTIKITNNTQHPLNNFFFCLYNVQKFSFKPQTFSLLPKEHKLIQITLKIKSTKSIAKQFAYLKSTQVNKRLTLLINNFNSPQVRIRQPQQQMSDNMNTLSSRDYHQLHNRALNKIIGQQQKFQEGNIVREFNKTQNFSIGSSGKKDYFNTAKGEFYRQQRSLGKDYHYNNQQDQQYLRDIQKRNTQLQKQVQQLNEMVNRSNFQMQKIQHQNRFLSQQGSKLMKKISQKQARIKQLQNLYQKIVQQSSRYSSQVRELKQHLQRQRQLSRQSQKSRSQQMSKLYTSYQSRIKQLQQVVESSQRNSMDKFTKQFRKKVEQKDKELFEIRKSLEHQELLLKQHQINLLKAETENKTLREKKQFLQMQNTQLMEVNNNLKQQIFVYKSRVDQPSSNTKLQQYLQIALQSYKAQNENLKKSKYQLQKSLQGIINTNRQAQSQNSHLQHKIDSLNKELVRFQQQLHKQQMIKQQLKAEHHQKIKQITNKNILLLQNLTLQNNTKREQQAQRLNKEIEQKQKQIQQIKKQHQQQKTQLQQKIASLQKQSQKLTELQQENTQLQQKVKKYKKQTRKQLKSINDNAFDELRRIHDEKKALQKKVMKLEKIVFKLEMGGNINLNNNNNSNPISSMYRQNKNLQLAGTSDMNSKSQLNSKSQINSKSQTNNKYLHNHHQQQQSNLQQQQSDNTTSNNNTNTNRRQQRLNNNDQSSSYIRSRSQYDNLTGNNNNNRRTGIFNQRQHLNDSRSVSMKNAVMSPNVQLMSNVQQKQQPNYELFELREFVAFVHNQQQRFQYMFNLQSQLVDPLDYQGKPLTNIKPLYKAIKFFKVIQNKLKIMSQKVQQSLILSKQNAFIRQKLTQYQKGYQKGPKQSNKKDISHITIHNPMMRIQQEDGPSFFLNRTNLTNLNVFQMIEFLKGQMKKQYNKQVQNIKFIEQKHQILKKKIYREYRTRIIQIINENNQTKKSQNSNVMTITKLQNLIERFVQGLSNLSHKQAVLSKQIKIKNTYKNENGKLRQKINQLQHLLSEKHHGYCNRDPVKVFNCSTLINTNNLTNNNINQTTTIIKQQQWLQSIKLSAQLLTQKAQSERLKQELDVVRQDYNQLREEMNQLLVKNDDKDGEIIKLKRNQIQLQREYERQMERQNQILEQTKSKLGAGNGLKAKTKAIAKYQQKLKDKQKQIQLLKQQIQKKTLQLRTYKQKQKKWQQYINETNRSQEKQKSLASSYRRIEQNNTLIKQSNRQLRQQNNQLKDVVQRLQKQLEKKKVYIKNLKAEEDETRITKPMRVQETQLQIKQLEEVLKNTKQQLSKLKKAKQRQISKLQNDLLSTKNQSLIHVRSLQSVIRGTLDAVRKIFNSLKIFAKKKGVNINAKQTEINVPENILSVNAAQIYLQFEEILELLDN